MNFSIVKNFGYFIQVISSFTKTFGYTCNVDYVEKGLAEDFTKLDNVTTVTTHFINKEDNLPIDANVIILCVV